MNKKLLIFSMLGLFTLSSCNVSTNTNNNTSIKETTTATTTKTTTETITTIETTIPTITMEKENVLRSCISNLETNNCIINPGQGFYATHPFSLTKDGVIDNITWHNKVDFYHFRISLSAFSAKAGGEDIEIPLDALESLRLHFMKYQNQGATLIVRFAYDGFSGKKDLEPNIELIKKHISSLGPILSEFNCIEAIECGLIGPWGEMHSSIMDTQEVYNELFSTWLSSTTRIPILSRKPRYVYRFMNYDIDNLEDFTYQNEDYKRLGVFNDGYLGTDIDTGTYLNREKEVAWMDENLTTPYGGEVINPESDLTYIPNSINQEQFKTHLSYLNKEYDSNIITRWIDTTIEEIPGYEGYNLYNYMNNHMGYGFMLDKLDGYRLGDTYSLELTLKTVGFKKYLYDFKGEIVFVDKEENILNTYEFNIDSLTKTIEYQGESNAKIYLKIKDNLGRCYKLLNEEAIYKKELNMNYIGEI